MISKKLHIVWVRILKDRVFRISIVRISLWKKIQNATNALEARKVLRVVRLRPIRLPLVCDHSHIQGPFEFPPSLSDSGITIYTRVSGKDLLTVSSSWRNVTQHPSQPYVQIDAVTLVREGPRTDRPRGPLQLRACFSNFFPHNQQQQQQQQQQKGPRFRKSAPWLFSLKRGVQLELFAQPRLLL